MGFFQRLFGRHEQTRPIAASMAAATPGVREESERQAEPNQSVAVSPRPARRDRAQNPDGDGLQLTVELLATRRGFFASVAGESHYQATLRELHASGSDQHWVMLVPEPSNPYDANAVCVRTYQNRPIGYLPRDVAGRYQPTLVAIRQRGGIPVALAKLYGGSGGQSLGIYLDLESPTAVAKAAGVKYQRQRQP